MTQSGQTKAELRAQFLAERQALPAAVVEQQSQAIADRFFAQFALPPTTCVHVFLPIRHRNEVNTWPIIHRIWQDYPNVKVATSIMDRQINRLSHYRLTPDTRLTENRWGIPEPVVVSDELASSMFGYVLVPLLAFDRRGHRVGYGKGYYDRFLAECQPDCLRIGLSLFDPVERINDVEQTDVPLNLCIIPEKIYWF